jgi:hypothetical protein
VALRVPVNYRSFIIDYNLVALRVPVNYRSFIIDYQGVALRGIINYRSSIIDYIFLHCRCPHCIVHVGINRLQQHLFVSDLIVSSLELYSFI